VMRHLNGDGTFETLNLTTEDLATVEGRFTQDNLVTLVVTFDDGDRSRSYRFIDTQPSFRRAANSETGKVERHFRVIEPACSPGHGPS
jgi:hypothetical protein